LSNAELVRIAMGGQDSLPHQFSRLPRWAWRAPTLVSTRLPANPTLAPAGMVSHCL